jgi:hypothetical protein
VSGWEGPVIGTRVERLWRLAREREPRHPCDAGCGGMLVAPGTCRACGERAETVARLRRSAARLRAMVERGPDV